MMQVRYKLEDHLYMYFGLEADIFLMVAEWEKNAPVRCRIKILNATDSGAVKNQLKQIIYFVAKEVSVLDILLEEIEILCNGEASSLNEKGEVTLRNLWGMLNATASVDENIGEDMIYSESSPKDLPDDDSEYSTSEYYGEADGYWDDIEPWVPPSGTSVDISMLSPGESISVWFDDSGEIVLNEDGSTFTSNGNLPIGYVPEIVLRSKRKLSNRIKKLIKRILNNIFGSRTNKFKQ